MLSVKTKSATTTLFPCPSSLLLTLSMFTSIDLVFRFRMRIIKNEPNEINDASYPGERQLQ